MTHYEKGCLSHVSQCVITFAAVLQDMQPGVRVCVSNRMLLSLFCHGRLGRTLKRPGCSFGSSAWQMSRWNNQDIQNPAPPQENPRVLITGDINIQSGVGFLTI